MAPQFEREREVMCDHIHLNKETNTSLNIFPNGYDAFEKYNPLRIELHG
jgi:hypothetical protein